MEFPTTTTPPATAVVQAPAVPPVTPPAAVAAPTPAAPDSAGTAPAAAVPAVAADPRAEVNALAAEFGYSPEQFNQFPDAASARAALRFETEQMAQLGLQAQQPAAPTWQSPQQYQHVAGLPPTAAPFAAPAAPAVVAPVLDLKALGLDEEEPAAKAIRALEKQLTSGGDSAKALAARLDAYEGQQRQANQQRLQSEAASIVDGMASPVYGVAGRRTYNQQVAVQKLYDAADVVYIGAIRAGKQAPTVAARLARARLMIENETVIPGPAVTPANTPALRQASPATPGSGAPEMSMSERWADNPAFMSKIAS